MTSLHSIVDDLARSYQRGTRETGTALRDGRDKLLVRKARGLLQSGKANPNALDKKNRTPITSLSVKSIARTSWQALIKALLDNGGNPLQFDEPFGVRIHPEHCPKIFDYLAEQLLERQVLGKGLLDEQGGNLFHYAVKVAPKFALNLITHLERNSKYGREMAKAGIDAVDAQGRTPLQVLWEQPTDLNTCLRLTLRLMHHGADCLIMEVGDQRLGHRILSRATIAPISGTREAKAISLVEQKLLECQTGSASAGGRSGRPERL